jgi:hypothetical protein
MNELTIFICAIRIISAYIIFICFLVFESVLGGGSWMNESNILVAEIWITHTRIFSDIIQKSLSTYKDVFRISAIAILILTILLIFILI